MLLSLSRAIVILFPFYQIKKRFVFLSIAFYFIYEFILTAFYLSFTAHPFYSPAIAICIIYHDNLLYTFFNTNYSICLLIPQIIVFFAFLLSITKLLRGNLLAAGDDHPRQLRQASITITYFSAIFLFCNSFPFINQSLFLFTMAWYKEYPGPLYDNTFMYFYSWLLCDVFCVVLNASLNPLFYVWRMKEMRLWICRLFRKRSVTPSMEVTRCSVERASTVECEGYDHEKLAGRKFTGTRILHPDELLDWLYPYDPH